MNEVIMPKANDTPPVMNTSDIYGKLLEGLAEVGISEEELKSGDWRCAGGAHGVRFDKEYPEYERPPHEEKCLCGRDIVYNAYIYNKKKDMFAVLGSCCINHFVPGGTKRLCDNCNCMLYSTKGKICKRCRKKPRHYTR